MVGLGTLLNMAAIVVGSGIGVVVGGRLPQRTRDLITQALGLVTLVVAAINVLALSEAAWIADVGATAPLLIVLGSVLMGGVIGSLVRIEDRAEALGGWLQRRVSKEADSRGRARFIEGFVDASLLFCIGPLAILGALSDGLGQGLDQLALKSVIDGFAAIAFAATLGWGVAFSALAVGVVQGIFTLLGVVVGSVLAASAIASITATGGVLLIGLSLRLLGLSRLPVADLLPALVIAPLLTLAVVAVRGG
ncbi:MAG: DUF554 domain-containing protein [Candidatus Nanopelagicales bacterium]